MLEDLYARADNIIDGITPHAVATAKAEMHGLLAEAALAGNRFGYDRPTPDHPQARRYTALVSLRGGNRNAQERIEFMAIPGPLTTERAADLEAAHRFGANALPYVIKTSIQRV